ncbi:type II secretion system protein J (GspJ) [Duganella sp. CF458]|uniref:PulJ/GspJ family protein n=1 Tax=Duganella sp. CF458 TaxID=1884368 RepID=UPI0008E071B3|nr:prepilin-type N-terminal cleavage/methylation domain-containing protein [Duganella sp. CF458]SFF69029.1 type II secretion system protein J (GspJ) [Duganella sp. CF458]
MNSARGFTLIELLVAITVLAIVAVLGWRGLDGIVRSREQLTQNMEQTRGTQLTFAQLQSDLEQIADKTLLRERQNMLAESNRLVFVRTVLVENAASQLQVVSYTIRDGLLARTESQGARDLLQLDALWKAALEQSTTQSMVGLQAGVANMEFRVWEGGGWRQPNNAASEPAAPKCEDPDPNKCKDFTPKPANKAEGPTGLEISLQIQGQPAPLVKVFLLGSV